MKTFTIISIAVLSFIAFAHLLRLFFNWEIVANGAVIPVWISVFPVVFFAGLAYMLWRESGLAKGQSHRNNSTNK